MATITIARNYIPAHIKQGCIVVSEKGRRLAVLTIGTGSFEAISASAKRYSFDTSTGQCITPGETWRLAGVLEDVVGRAGEKTSHGNVIDCQGKHDFRHSNQVVGKTKWCARCDHRE